MTALGIAADRFAAGELVLVGDESDDAVFVAAAAGDITPDGLARLHELGRGSVVLGLAEQAVERLCLPAPVGVGEGLRMITPIDAATRSGGGWSLNERAHTMRVAARAESGPRDLRVPGHVLAAQIGQSGAGVAAAALELARLAGPSTAVALSAVLDRSGAVARLADLRGTNRLRRLAHVSSGELRSHAVSRAAAAQAASCELPTRDGRFRGIAFGDERSDTASVALVHGDLERSAAPLVHVHVACRFGDVFGSLLCNCREELYDAVAQIVAAGAGVIVYSPSADVFQTCAREQPVDVSLVAGLLRASGLRALRPTPRAAELAQDLRAHGLEVIS